jgi:ABC-type uncharacterized transport system auxiliary subunit
MRLSRLLSWPLLTLVPFMALVGCAQAPVPADRYYRLLPPTPRALERPALPGTLLVRRFAADGLLGQRALVYAERAAPGVLYQYRYHFWADAPGVLLQDLTVQALRAARVAHEVVTPDHDVAARYVLVGRVRRLEHLLGDAPAVTVSLELVITGADREAPIVLGDHQLTLPLDAPDVDAAVHAMSEAVAQILAEFIARLPGS